MKFIPVKYFTSAFTVGITAFLLNSNVVSAQVTFSSGSTITTDGEVYAPGELSPNQEKQVKNLIASGEESGVVGTNLFVQVGDEIVVVPMDEIEGKDKEDIVKIFKPRVIEVLERNLNKNSEQASRGLQNAWTNQEGAIDKATSKIEKATEKAEKAAEWSAKAAEKTAKKAAKKAEKAAEWAAKAAEEAAEKAEWAAKEAAEKAEWAAKEVAEKAEWAAKEAAEKAEWSAKKAEKVSKGGGKDNGGGKGYK